MSKIKSFFGTIIAFVLGILPVALALFTFLNLRLCKMPDNTMGKSVEKGSYVISIRKDVEDIDAGTLVVVNTSKDDRTVRVLRSCNGDSVYVSDINGNNCKTYNADDIWGTIWFQFG